MIIVVAWALFFPAPAFAAATHTVGNGDTLSAIAARYGVSTAELIAANPLPDSDRLRAGRRPVIPGRQARRPAARMGRLPSRGAAWTALLAAAARRHLGVRYRWGGRSPAGFDCSGFVSYVLRRVRVTVPRTTWALWTQGTPVARDQLEAGDLVFFTTTRPGPSHVGLYLGANQFVHASSGFGRVTVTSLEHRYYRARYLGARRF
ncbi:MAG: LysM peptidoglycan-binding domain-containing C40 family peptidase [Armatimonadota bacterium]|nr:LysM peptidoglycan-binding domain-containing C40 family peptidase [Armatimonadota bacterium]MDR7499122.1 LysM peptidoglycan-binding domain-containing C40 family peptidase [Armatimonadota bacterium]MDR7547132.1 LysM peptidoglycan-binding domain-containing C40 family peptidase [Armatimonadota bacterium]MDR7552348.1 LysM peptidoglycan-binding domain-containing C40 family peptidase [Armatimonadota bacterium]MDR7556934.1 LysM peptidoglycan-binding domain-containing C40 family peptidase [Armatimon